MKYFIGLRDLFFRNSDTNLVTFQIEVDKAETHDFINSEWDIVAVDPSLIGMIHS